MNKGRPAAELARTSIIRKLSKAERYLDNYCYRMEQIQIDFLKSKIHAIRAKMQSLGAES